MPDKISELGVEGGGGGGRGGGEESIDLVVVVVVVVVATRSCKLGLPPLNLRELCLLRRGKSLCMWLFPVVTLYQPNQAGALRQKIRMRPHRHMMAV